MYLYRREGIKGIGYEIPRLTAHIIRVLKSDCNKKMTRIKIIIKATLKGIRFNPDIEYV